MGSVFARKLEVFDFKRKLEGSHSIFLFITIYIYQRNKAMLLKCSIFQLIKLNKR